MAGHQINIVWDGWIEVKKSFDNKNINIYNMVAGSILPVAIHNNKLYFLFGKERSNDSSPGWSDFGGGVENSETPLETALREGGEELTGFLGDSDDLSKYKIVHKILWGVYHLHVILIKYDENLPIYYNNNHNFLWKRMNNDVLEKTKLFEKVNIEWFSPGQIKSRRSQFRGFYQNIVDLILKDLPIIHRCALKMQLEPFLFANKTAHFGAVSKRKGVKTKLNMKNINHNSKKRCRGHNSNSSKRRKIRNSSKNKK